jgi:RimJ/RimL family protein N-acetyltransferase
MARRRHVLSAQLVTIEPWGLGDRALLGRVLGDPRMTEHVGGPFSDDDLDSRNVRYAQPGSRQYKVVCDGEPCGYVGYWERTAADGKQFWECGWFIVPEFQGRGVSTRAMHLLLKIIRSEGSWSDLHAWPAVANAPSNALCRKLGFKLAGSFDYEFRGTTLRCNDWVLDLGLSGSQAAAE